MKKIILYALIIVSIFPRNISEIGYGESEEEAKKEALSFLAQAISVDVQSSYSDFLKQSGDKIEKQKEKNVYLKSNLPLLGVLFSSEYEDDMYMVEALLTNESIEVYEDELDRIKAEITELQEIFDGLVQDGQKVDVIKVILNKIDNYNRYYSVLNFLSDNDYGFEYFDRVEYELLLRKLEKRYDNLDYAIVNTFEYFDYEDVYVYPATESGLDEVSELGSIVEIKVEDFLDEKNSELDGAEYLLMGTYEVFDKQIFMQYRLLDLDGEVVETYTIQLEPEAYKDYEVFSKTNNFDKLLKDGYIISSEFTAILSTSSGNENLLFRSDDEFSLLVKSNRSAYIYLVGHTFQKDTQYSYLVDFNEANGNRKFVYYIGPDEVNRWIDLGSFEVIPPYGVEALQIFASTKDIVDNIPEYYYDYSSGLYLLEDNPIKSVDNMRAIVKKNRKLNEVTESFIIFTTSK